MPITEYVDESLTFEEGLTLEDIRAQEVDRLQEAYGMATFSARQPRRLGAEATRAELARDKKISRRLQHLTYQLLLAWDEAAAEPDDSLRPAAAQVDWEAWRAERTAWLVARRTYLASWAVSIDDVRLGNRLAYLITREIDGLALAFR